MSLAEPIEVTREFTTGLDDLGLSYVVGGSLANSLHGIPRSTRDIDAVVMIFGKDVASFVARFSDTFYVDRDMIVDAIRRRASFNIIHLRTMYKIDIFTFDHSELLQRALSNAGIG
jgi:hypothetical protein